MTQTSHTMRSVNFVNLKLMGLLNKDSVFLSNGLIDSTIKLHRIGLIGDDIPAKIAGAVGLVAACMFALELLGSDSGSGSSRWGVRRARRLQR